jgi:GNAT superfamily N-acetyltransferase
VTEYLSLNKANRILIARAFADVLRVDMSIDCVIEDQMGQALVDNARSPAVFKLEVGSFRYFAGNAASAEGQSLIDSLRPYTFIMPSAPGWAEAAKDKYQDRLIPIDRFRYSSERLAAEHLRVLINRSDLNDEVKRMDVEFAQQFWERDHFIHLSDYESPEDFVKRGVGYYLEHDGEVIGAAYASLVCSQGIEVSIFVQETFRRRGIATLLASHLLSWCLERHVHPNWDAANPPSCGLAEKLGYQPLGRYQAYYLKG